MNTARNGIPSAAFLPHNHPTANRDHGCPPHQLMGSSGLLIPLLEATSRTGRHPVDPTATLYPYYIPLSTLGNGKEHRQSTLSGSQSYRISLCCCTLTALNRPQVMSVADGPCTVWEMGSSALSPLEAATGAKKRK